MKGRLHGGRSRSEVTVIDDSDIVGWAASATRTDEIYMDDVKSMVDSVIKKVTATKVGLRRLNILDHGNANGFEVGKDWIEIGNIGKYEGTLRLLRSHFAKNGFVHLQHCDVGQNHALLARLSSILGVPVYAGTGAHNPVYRFNFGHYDRCFPDGKCEANVDRP